MALTFDDGPTGSLTAEILSILQEEDVPATFFLCGYRIEQFPEQAALLGAAGHELGVHGYSHASMPGLAPNALREELERTVFLIMEHTGREPTVLRPPGGLLNNSVCRESERLGFPVILWSVDPEDWRSGVTPEQIVRETVRKSSDGDIILLHDLNRRTVDALPQLIRQLKERGFTFLTVSQLAAQQGITPEAGRCFHHFSPDQDRKVP